MSDRSIEDLRAELRNLGYLSHGLERWFSRDPWKSGTFWAELMLVASKSSLVIALFVTVAATTAMILHNGGLPPLETTVIAILYFATGFAGSILLHVLVAMLLKVRPAFGIEKPRALMVIAMALSGLIAMLLIAWWYAFPSAPGLTERIVFIALLMMLFVASSIVISAALLSFSIHEAHAIPRIHRKPRTVPLAIGAILLLVLVFGRTCTNPRAEGLLEAPQIVVRPSSARVALVAVDGLTEDLYELRPELRDALSTSRTVAPPDAISAPEAWATIGTGTSPSLHGVRSVEGIRIAHGRRVIQSVSRLDVPLRTLAPLIGLAERQPLPPSVRNRHYVWESLAGRGVPSLAVNWWTTEDTPSGSLRTVSQATVFDRASLEGDRPAELALEIDRLAIEIFEEHLDAADPRFATLYLPALDVILNRVSVAEQTKLASTIRALDQLTAVVRFLSDRGWSLILVGAPGDGEGRAIVATSTDIDLSDANLLDVAPTILTLYGFPPSYEMPGSSLAGEPERVTSYGSRESTETPAVDDDYYENLKSLGYIQ